MLCIWTVWAGAHNLNNSRAFLNNLDLSNLFPLGLNPRGNNSLKDLLLSTNTNC